MQPLLPQPRKPRELLPHPSRALDPFLGKGTCSDPAELSSQGLLFQHLHLPCQAPKGRGRSDPALELCPSRAAAVFGMDWSRQAGKCHLQAKGDVVIYLWFGLGECWILPLPSNPIPYLGRAELSPARRADQNGGSWPSTGQYLLQDQARPRMVKPAVNQQIKIPRKKNANMGFFGFVLHFFSPQKTARSSNKPHLSSTLR